MEGSVDCKKIKIMVLNVVLFCFTEPVTEPFVLLNGPVAECLRLAVWAGKKMFLNEKGACQNDMKTVFFTIFWFCFMARYRTLCFA